MPLGIVKDTDYNKILGIIPEKESEEKEEWKEIQEQIPLREFPIPTRTPEVKETQLGRGQGNTEVPESIRKLIGASSVEEGSPAAQAIGKFLGISPSSVSAYSHGATSTATYNTPNKDLSQFLLKTREKITKRAQGRLHKALGVISDEKLEQASAMEAATIAKNMSAIVKNLEPDHRYIHNQNNFNGPIVTFYAPSLVSEEKFDVIDVTAVGE